MKHENQPETPLVYTVFREFPKPTEASERKKIILGHLSPEYLITPKHISALIAEYDGYNVSPFIIIQTLQSVIQRNENISDNALVKVFGYPGLYTLAPIEKTEEAVLFPRLGKPEFRIHAILRQNSNFNTADIASEYLAIYGERSNGKNIRTHIHRMKKKIHELFGETVVHKARGYSLSSDLQHQLGT